MIYALRYPLTHYKILGVGILEMFQQDEDYFALFALLNPALFELESKLRPEHHFPKFVIRDDNMVKTLDGLVGGETVRSLLRVHTPMDTVSIFDRFQKDVSKLPICHKGVRGIGDYPYKDVIRFMLVRATAWAIGYNESLGDDGGVFSQSKIILPQGYINYYNTVQEVVDGRFS